MEQNQSTTSSARPSLSFIESPADHSHHAEIEAAIREDMTDGRRVLPLRCNVEEQGVWAGLEGWLRGLLPEIEERAPSLVERHAHELVMILPKARERIRSNRLTLTDKASEGESVRNYPIDRGYRIGQGIVDLLNAWYCDHDEPGLVIICFEFDRAGALVQHFFRQLLRRRGAALDLSLVLVVSPGMASAEIERWPVRGPTSVTRWQSDATPARTPTRAQCGDRAREIERQVANDRLAMEDRIPRLIRLWEASDEPERALSYRALALGLYNHYGFYEEAIRHVDPLLENLHRIAPLPGFEPFFTRWNLVGSAYGCLVANGQAERALSVMETEAIGKITSGDDLVRIHYAMAMLYARHLPETDFAIAEEHLQAGLRTLHALTDISELDRVFLGVFLQNGLALVRYRQKRPAEAIELCRNGYERMRRHWGDDGHRLHQSVLLYNQAQVFAALKQYPEAIEKFGQALVMDPNYSEYYNERGNAWLALQRFEEAAADYRAAIQASPPYPEVWSNLGQCLRHMGDLTGACDAYSRALDLDPEIRLARVGRAQAFAALGEPQLAENDYDLLLSGDCDEPLIWANRAVLRFERGAYEESLADLDEAIRCGPEIAELYKNRSIALEALGEISRAKGDFRTYLELAPHREDRRDVEVLAS